MRDVIQIINANSTYKSNPNQRPLFAYGFFSGLLHEDVNEYAHMDRLLDRFFRSLHDSGHLDNTALVLFSDHGARFGATRGYTRLGWYEENLPVAMIGTCILTFSSGLELPGGVGGLNPQ